ncbi:MAG: hypothetical protein AAFY27_11845, partial [Pseudomonadota bacterium]
ATYARLQTLFLLVFAKLALAALIMLTPIHAAAHELRGAQHPHSESDLHVGAQSLRGSHADTQPESAHSQRGAGVRRDGLGMRGSVPGFRLNRFSSQARRQALEAVQTVLSEVEDGSTYVWFRQNTDLTGLFKPVRSFADAGGRICRQLRITLMAGPVTKTVEGTACRMPSGIWNLGRI